MGRKVAFSSYVKLEAIDRYDLRLALLPCWVRGDANHNVVHRQSAHKPWTCPVLGELPDVAGGRLWGEQPYLRARQEGLAVLVVLAALTSYGLLEVSADVAVSPDDAVLEGRSVGLGRLVREARGS